MALDVVDGLEVEDAVRQQEETGVVDERGDFPA